METLDITVDLETTACTPQAGIMQIAAVAWDRYAAEFDENAVVSQINLGVDLRGQIINGCDFDPETIKWWNERPAQTKEAVCSSPAEPIHIALERFQDWVEALLGEYNPQRFCLWSQGADFDFPILRTAMKQHDAGFFDRHPHTCLRDARTFCLEVDEMLFRHRKMNEVPHTNEGKDGADSQFFPAVAYEELRRGHKYPYDNLCKHDALSDAAYTSWLSWLALRKMSDLPLPVNPKQRGRLAEPMRTVCDLMGN